MTAIFVGFNENFIEAYFTGLIISMIVATILSFLTTPLLRKLILGKHKISNSRLLIFDLFLAIDLTSGVTFFILIISQGLALDFFVNWLKMWLVAAILAFVIIQLASEKFQDFTVKVIK
jgi:hypothetical protein